MAKKRSAIVGIALCLALIGGLALSCAAPPAEAPELQKELAAKKAEITKLNKEVAVQKFEVAKLENEVAKLKAPKKVKPITLKMITYLPSIDRHIKYHLEGKDMIEKATDGRVKLEIYHSASICKGPEEWDFVNRGVADLSVSYMGYQSATMSLLGLDTMPFEWIHFVGNANAWPELIPLYDEEYKEHKFDNLVTLCAKFSGGRYIGTTKKQLKLPADMEGLKIRQSGAMEQLEVELCGGTNVYITGAEIYEALERGIVDGSYGCPVNWVDWKWMETIDYLLNLCVGQTSVHVLANKNSLAKLSEQDREVVTQILKYQAEQARMTVVEYEDYFLHTVIPANVTVYTPSAEEVAVWKDTLSPVIGDWLELTGARGQKALDIVRKYNVR